MLKCKIQGLSAIKNNSVTAALGGDTDTCNS